MLPGVKEGCCSRLKKVSGQINGIEKMVKDERYCIDILTQVSAARSALDKVGLLILRGHLETCVADAIKKDKGDALLDELEKTLSKFLR